MTEVSDKLQRALQLHQAGEVVQAQAIYEEILTVQPRHCDVINLLGAIVLQSGDLQRALALFERAIEIDPAQVVAHCNSGLALTQLKQFHRALERYERAIELGADVADVHFRRGNVLRELRQLDAALESYRRTVGLEPDYAEAHLGCGLVLGEHQQFEAALESFDQAIAAVPDYEEAFFNRGIVLNELGRWDQAVSSFDRAIEFKPDRAEAYFCRANALESLQRLDAALADHDRAIALRADFAEAHLNRGNVLLQLRQLEVAAASYRRALQLKPDFAEAHNNLGGMQLNYLSQPEAAAVSYRRALELKPDDAEARGNLGGALRVLGELDLALDSLNQAIVLNPDSADARVNRSMIWLLRGDLEKAWIEYEWRKKIRDRLFKEERAFQQPLWLGKEPLEGKRILLYAEQGLGDALQFCRYVDLVAKRGARVILEVQAPLRDLLARLQGASQVVARGDELPKVDYQCPLLSLPLAFNTRLSSIPAPVGYIHSDPAKVKRWQARLGARRGVRVGLVWHGNPRFPREHMRGIALADLLRCLPQGPQYISLQKELSEEDRAALQALGIPQFADELQDFNDTAGLCECMDLVISTDTSVAHLSAALGKRTWILLHWPADWRWFLDREDSPWYPTAKLYRQSVRGQWGEVLEKVGMELKQAFI